MKNLWNLYKSKILKSPNLEGSKKSNIICFILDAFCLLYFVVPALVHGSVLCMILCPILSIMCIDCFVSACIIRKELKDRAEAQKKP